MTNIEQDAWDMYAAAALTRWSSTDACAQNADLMMKERNKRFGQQKKTPEEYADLLMQRYSAVECDMSTYEETYKKILVETFKQAMGVE